ncbi:MAG TPA: NotI family restriction endonuclease [Terriglobia bacterium]|nr:NotI family restriction endonuclease [Terriglobia bacterium]
MAISASHGPFGFNVCGFCGSIPAVAKAEKAKAPRLRFGIGEWYGVPLTALGLEQRRRFAQIQFLPKSEKPRVPCPFQQDTECSKAGGVCSLQLYEKSTDSGEVRPAAGEPGRLRTVCPSRFEERQLIYRWVGEVVLGSNDPVILGEIGFLESASSTELEATPADVGRIDRVLVDPRNEPFSWCALEFQAVYFQGRAMKNDFTMIRDHSAVELPFPEVLRRPDYRSSGPKRLMPQLQIKVPSLRRWGKKMAVVVDQSFFEAMGKMRSVPHISNCDVVWFVLGYEPAENGHYRLVKKNVHFTTLEDSVEGLTAGVPVSLATFEKRILAKLERLSGPAKITAD